MEGAVMVLLKWSAMLVLALLGDTGMAKGYMLHDLIIFPNIYIMTWIWTYQNQ